MRIIILDRDGVINKDYGYGTYVTGWDKFVFLNQVFEALKKLKDNGYKVVICSNQAGVAKGLYSKKDVDCLTAKMIKKIRENNGDIEKVYYCFHKDEDECDCRKPKAGLLNKVINEFGIKNVANVFFIGDTVRDIMAGKKRGLKTILVLSGNTTLKDTKEWEVKPDYIADNLKAAVDIIIDGK